MRWMIYGAAGYSGALIAAEAVRRGHAPLLAGRCEAELAPLARKLGLPFVQIDLSDRQALSRSLMGCKLVLHTAGPFVDTSAPMLRACLDLGVDYVDIAGELPVLRDVYARHAEAVERGILLMPGLGLDVVPGDCLARYVSDRVPNAVELEIAISPVLRPSAGSLKSSLEMVLGGGFVRRDGSLEPRPIGAGARLVRFPNGVHCAVPAPWGDLEAAQRSTSIPNITTYIVVPPWLASLAAATSGQRCAAARARLCTLASRRPIKRALTSAIERVIKGGDARARAEGRSYIWARATDAEGVSCQAWLETLDGYELTAVASIRAIEHIFRSSPRGARTPSQAFGPDFILEIEGSRRYSRLPGAAACPASVSCARP